MQRPHDKLRDDIVWARETLRDAGVSLQMRRVADGLYDSFDEALAEIDDEPRPVTVQDLLDAMHALLPHAESIREFVALHGEAWPEHVRERWLVGAEELEDRHARLAAELSLDPENDNG
jgi:acetyl esterase/lipase